MKKLAIRWVGVLTAATLILGVPAFAAGTPPLLVPVAADEALFFLSEEGPTNDLSSALFLQPDAPDANLNREPWIQCPAVDDPICDFSKPGYGGLYWGTLPLCKAEGSEYCIEDFSIVKGETVHEAQYLGQIPGGTGFPADEKTQLFEGGAALLFKVPGAKHSGGDVYLVSARATLNYDNRAERFVTNDFYIHVVPVTVESPGYSSSFPNTMPCVWENSSGCGVAHDFDLDARPKVSARVSKEVGGWFLGRMKAPNIKVEDFSARNSRLIVEANAVEVARFAWKAKKSEVTFEDRKAAGNSGSLGEFSGNGPVRIFNSGYDDSNFGMLAHFRDRVKDTAVGTTSHWTLRTTSSGQGSQCLDDKSQVLGIVSTNAMVYDGFSPKFSGGFLDYRVAGLHYLPDGKNLVEGSYDLVMRSETARCLYGFSKAPVSAKIQVIGTAGEEKVATTIVSERDGWLKLAAYGFTFSEKKVKVEISQQVEIVQPITNPKAVTKLLAKFPAKSLVLSAAQKKEINAVMKASALNTKFICTGNFVKPAEKAVALSRARAACNYAKSKDPSFSFVAQALPTKTASLNGRVTVSSK
jgi:hypothetical protein